MPQLETLVAQQAPASGPGAAPDVSAPGRSLVAGLTELKGITEAVIDAEYAGRARRASATAEKELYDLAEEMNNSTDYENAEGIFEQRAKEIRERNRTEVTGGFFQEAFDESVGGFAERMRHQVVAGTRVKRIDASKAALDEELETRAGLYARLWDDPDARDAQQKEYERSIEIQRASGLLTEQEAVNYKQGFASRSAALASAAARQSEIHGRVLEIMASTESKADALKLADESDPAIAQDVFRRVKSRFDAQEAARVDVEREALDRGYPALEEAFVNGVRTGPGEHDVIPPGPEAAYYALDRLDVPAHMVPKFEKAIGQLSTRAERTSENAFAREWDRLTSLRDSTDPKERREFEDVDLHEMALVYPNYREEIKSLMGQQKAARQGKEPGKDETSRAVELFVERFGDDALKKNPDDEDRAKLSMFKLRYGQEYQLRSRQKGGTALSRKEEEELARDLLAPLIVGEEVYHFERPPQLSPRARPPDAKSAARDAVRRAAGGEDDALKPIPQPPIPAQAEPFTSVYDNPDLALRAEVDLLDRTGKAPTREEIVVEMNRMRGVQR